MCKVGQQDNINNSLSYVFDNKKKQNIDIGQRE